MSRLWPHASYAEDQPHSHAILGTHVFVRGITTGAVLTSTYTTLRQAIPRFRRPHFPTRLLVNSARGALWTAPLSVLAMYARMYGREEIEWQDRSWRLLENRFQMEVDDWTAGGSALGLGGWLVSGGMNGVRPAMQGVGAVSLGGIGGTIGYMVWRHGINGGRYPERKDL